MKKANFILITLLFICLGHLNASTGWVNVQEQGVVADGLTPQQEKIQNLIDRLSADGGGTLYFPPGDYVSGTIHLKDNITLYLENNASILGSDRIEDYDRGGLIRAESVKNIALLGQGTINGRGFLWWIDNREEWTEEEYENHRRRKWGWVPTHVRRHPRSRPGNAIRFTDCQNVTIRDITLTDSESWNLNLLGCMDVTIDGVRLNSDLTGPNSDGIDICSSQDVTISNSEIYCGDDAIVIKNEDRDYTHMTCKNIAVTNCFITTTCNGFKIGTGTQGDFENITFSNSVIKAGLPDEPLARKAAETLHPEAIDNGLAPLSGIALECVDGGYVRGITISNIVMHGVRTPIFIRLGNRGRGQDADNPVPGTLSKINISNVIAYDAINASSIMGIPGYPVRNVSLNNILIHTDGSGTREMAEREVPERIDSYPEAYSFGRMPAYGLYCRHAEGMILNNVKILADAPDERPLLICDDVENLFIDKLNTSSNVVPESLVRLVNVRKAFITNAVNQTKASDWIEVSGSDTKEIRIQDLFPSMMNKVGRENEVRAGEIIFE